MIWFCCLLESCKQHALVFRNILKKIVQLLHFPLALRNTELSIIFITRNIQVKLPCKTFIKFIKIQFALKYIICPITTGFFPFLVGFPSMSKTISISALEKNKLLSSRLGKLLFAHNIFVANCT